MFLSINHGFLTTHFWDLIDFHLVSMWSMTFFIFLVWIKIKFIKRYKRYLLLSFISFIFTCKNNWFFFSKKSQKILVWFHFINSYIHNTQSILSTNNIWTLLLLNFIQLTAIKHIAYTLLNPYTMHVFSSYKGVWCSRSLMWQEFFKTKLCSWTMKDKTWLSFIENRIELGGLITFSRELKSAHICRTFFSVNYFGCYYWPKSTPSINFSFIKVKTNITIILPC